MLQTFQICDMLTVMCAISFVYVILEIYLAITNITMTGELNCDEPYDCIHSTIGLTPPVCWEFMTPLCERLFSFLVTTIMWLTL